MRIDLFFGAGGAYFNLPKPKYAVLNDYDDELVNCYLTILEKKQELIWELQKLPIATGLVQYWKKNQETDPIRKAIRFILLSNFTYLGKGDTLRIGLDNTKQMLIPKIDDIFIQLSNAKITCDDFRDVLPKVSFSSRLLSRSDTFLYLDPIYLETEYFYKVPAWNKDDTIDCLEILKTSGINAAMSEADHPFVTAEAKSRGLNIIPICQRNNIKNKMKEILITNYDSTSLFSH